MKFSGGQGKEQFDVSNCNGTTLLLNILPEEIHRAKRPHDNIPEKAP